MMLQKMNGIMPVSYTHLYREGDLSEEASVTIHSLDLTAIYGEDYIILDDNAEKTGDGVSILERCLLYTSRCV